MSVERFPDYRTALLDVAQRFIDGKSGLCSIMLKPSAERIPFITVGYSSNRWLRYVDNYLNGGLAFEKFLVTAAAQPKYAHTFVTHGNSAHTYGECIISITIAPRRVHLNSRAMHWLGPGVLDLNLAWMLSRRFDRPVWITCPDVRVTLKDLVGCRWSHELDGPLVTKALKMRGKEHAFGALNRRANSHHFTASPDEEEILTRFVRASPEDYARFLKIRGSHVRDEIRAHIGKSLANDRPSHSFADYKTGVGKLLKATFGKAPPVAQLVAHRIALKVRTKA